MKTVLLVSLFLCFISSAFSGIAWTKTTSATTKTGVASTSLGSVAYFAGGSDGNYLNTVETYNVATGTWGKEKNLTIARWYITAVSIQYGSTSMALFGGGGYYANNNNIDARRVDTYNATSKTWVSADSLTLARHNLGGGSNGH